MVDSFLGGKKNEFPLFFAGCLLGGSSVFCNREIRSIAVTFGE